MAKTKELTIEEKAAAYDEVVSQLAELQNQNVQLNEKLAIQEMQDAPMPVIKEGKTKYVFTTGKFIMGTKKYVAKDIAKEPKAYAELIAELTKTDDDGKMVYGILKPQN